MLLGIQCSSTMSNGTSKIKAEIKTRDSKAARCRLNASPARMGPRIEPSCQDAFIMLLYRPLRFSEARSLTNAGRLENRSVSPTAVTANEKKKPIEAGVGLRKPEIKIIKYAVAKINVAIPMTRVLLTCLTDLWIKSWPNTMTMLLIPKASPIVFVETCACTMLHCGKTVDVMPVMTRAIIK